MRRYIAVLLAVPFALAAQQPAADSPALARALALLKADNAWTLQKQTALCEIPAPPFKEQLRGVAFRKELIALGYADAHIDDVGNVIAEVQGASKGPTVLIAGHLDTVFPEGTDVTVKRDGARLTGPGIGDDCRGLAVVLATARAVKQSGLKFAGRVIIVANVGEEGAGNLRGTKHLLGTSYKGQVDYFISVDGTGNDIVSRAVGSNRYNVHFKSPGGHSYGAFGMPNPIHAMGRAIASISDIQVPRSPRTTFNVGIVSGGAQGELYAAIAAVNATVWVSGTTYAVGDGRFSPINFQTYRRKTAGAGTTDPSLDPTNWALIGSLPWSRKTGAYTAVSFDRIKASTTGGAWSLTFPASPVDGDVIEIQPDDWRSARAWATCRSASACTMISA